MIDYSEKRDFIRMPVRCPVFIRGMDDAQPETAELLDLSASGVRFVSPFAVDQGARLQLLVRPARSITPPLEAEISVIRCEPLEQGFAVAALIEAVAPATYPDAG